MLKVHQEREEGHVLNVLNANWEGWGVLEKGRSEEIGGLQKAQIS